MSTLLTELLSHQSWADAEHWRVLQANPVALEDEAIRKRLHHYHLTANAFLAILRGEQAVLRKPGDFSTILELKEFGRQGYEALITFHRDVTDTRLKEVIALP